MTDKQIIELLEKENKIRKKYSDLKVGDVIYFRGSNGWDNWVDTAVVLNIHVPGRTIRCKYWDNRKPCVKNIANDTSWVYYKDLNDSEKEYVDKEDIK